MSKFYVNNIMYTSSTSTPTHPIPWRQIVVFPALNAMCHKMLRLGSSHKTNAAMNTICNHRCNRVVKMTNSLSSAFFDAHDSAQHTADQHTSRRFRSVQLRTAAAKQP